MLLRHLFGREGGQNVVDVVRNLLDQTGEDHDDLIVRLVLRVDDPQAQLFGVTDAGQ